MRERGIPVSLDHTPEGPRLCRRCDAPRSVVGSEPICDRYPNCGSTVRRGCVHPLPISASAYTPPEALPPEPKRRRRWWFIVWW